MIKRWLIPMALMLFACGAEAPGPGFSEGPSAADLDAFTADGPGEKPGENPGENKGAPVLSETLFIAPGDITLPEGAVFDFQARLTEPCPNACSLKWSLTEGTFRYGEDAALHKDTIWVTLPDAQTTVTLTAVLKHSGPEKRPDEYASVVITVGEDFVAAPYLSITPSFSAVNPGEILDLEAHIGQPPGSRTDRLTWSASEGELLPILAPAWPAYTAIARYAAPTAPGRYTLRVTSALYPDRIATATVTVKGGGGLLLNSDPSVIFTAPGQVQGAQVVSLGKDGQLTAPTGLIWASSDPSIVSVDGSGRMEAVASVGTAIITATSPGLPPVVITATVAALAPRARLVSSGAIRYVEGASAVLSNLGPSLPLAVGDVVFSGGSAGLFGRITALRTTADSHFVTLAPATLPEAFSRLSVHVQSPRVRVQEHITSGGGGSLRTGGDVTPGYTCEFTYDEGNPIEFEAGETEFDWDVGLGADYELGAGPTPEIALYLTGDMHVTVGGATLTATVKTQVGMICELSLDPVPLPAIFLGPVSLAASVTPSTGVELGAASVGTITLLAPTATKSLTDVRLGFTYDGESYAPLHEATEGPLGFSYPPGTSPLSVETEITASIRPFVAAQLGVGALLGPVFLNFDLLRTELFGLAELALPLPFNPIAQDYRGPSLTLSLGLNASLDPLLEDPVIPELLAALGVDEEVELDGQIFEEVRPVYTSPTFTLRGDPQPAGAPSKAVVTVEASADLTGAGVTLLSWPEGSPTASPSALGGGTMVGTEGEITVGWPADRRDVAARIYQGPFAAVGLPYGVGLVGIGGSNGSSCDGPDCAPTSPGGPPIGGSGTGGGTPGGGYGDPGDNGTPGEDGSVGGFPGAGTGGGSGGGSGGGHAGNGHGSAGSTGDPHIVSFDGLRFNFQGAGQYVLVGGVDAVGDYDPESDLVVQVRSLAVHPDLRGAVNTALGARIGAHTVEIYARPDAGQARLYVDGAPSTHSAGLLELPGSGGVHVDGATYTLLWEDGSQVTVRLGYAHLDVAPVLSDARYGAVAGLLGTFNGDPEDDFTPRGGAPLQRPLNYYQLYDVLGESWRVPAGEGLIDPGLGGGDPTDPGFPGGFPEANISDDDLDDAGARCAMGGATWEGVWQSCRFDVALYLQATPVDEAMIAAIIAGHAASQIDLFGAPGPVSLFLVPSARVVAQGETVTFTAAVKGSADRDVTWSADGRAFTEDGRGITWTAPSAPGTYALTATAVADPAQQASVVVTVPAVTITLDPPSAALLAGDTLVLTATVEGTVDTEVSWSASGGMLLDEGDGTATFTAGAGDYSITASAVAAPGVFATSVVSVEGGSPFEGWVEESPDNHGVWTVDPADGGRVTQALAQGPTWFVGPEDHLGVTFSGTMETTSADTNRMGIVFGYRDPVEGACGVTDPTCDVRFFLFDWSGHTRDGSPEGASLVHLNGALSVDSADEWVYHVDTPVFDVVADTYGAVAGWERGQPYDFTLLYTATRIAIAVQLAPGGGVIPIFDVTPEDVYGPGTAQTFPAGRLGLYSQDQGEVTFSNLGVSGG